MQTRFQEFMQRKRWSVVTLLVGLAGVTGALALSGPILGAGASPLAVPLILIGSAIAVVGLALMTWTKY